MRLGTGVLGDKPASIVWTDDDVDDGNDDNYSFVVDIGEAAPGRKVIFAVGTFTGLGTNVNAITFNGSPVTPLVTQSVLRLCIADAPTGTTATIGVTYSGADASGTGVMVWVVRDLKSGTPVDTAQTSLLSGTAAADLSVDTRSGGIVVAAAWGGANGTNQTWVGVNEDVENTSTSNNFCRSGASANISGGESPRTVTVTSSNTSSTRYVLAASFR